MGNFEFAYSLLGDNQPPAVQEFPVATTQTLVVGDLVYLSSGQVTKAAGDLADPLGVMAEASDGATAGTMVKVYVIHPWQVWRATADAAATSAVLGGGKYDLNADQTVDVGDSSNGCVLIHKTGDTTTDVYVSFTECVALFAS